MPFLLSLDEQYPATKTSPHVVSRSIKVCYRSPGLTQSPVPTVRHAEDNAGRAQTHPVSCISGSFNNEGH